MLKLSGVYFKKISEEDNGIFISALEEHEVKEVIWDCNGEVLLGPNGYNFKFINGIWKVLKEDILRTFTEFRENMVLPR